MMAYVQRRFNRKHESIEEFLLRFGEEFVERIEPDWLEMMTPKMCFLNCFELATERPDLRYYEGFVFVPDGLPIPIHHAWLLDSNGFVVEPTMRIADDETPTYFGLHVPTETLFEVVEETRTGSVLYKRQGHEAIERLHNEPV